MILTARHLTEADKRHLNGHVSTILSRGSVGAADLLGLLHAGGRQARKSVATAMSRRSSWSSRTTRPTRC